MLPLQHAKMGWQGSHGACPHLSKLESWSLPLGPTGVFSYAEAQEMSRLQVLGGGRGRMWSTNNLQCWAHWRSQVELWGSTFLQMSLAASATISGKFGPVCGAVAWKWSKNDLAKQYLVKMCYYDWEESMVKENMNKMHKRTVHLNPAEKVFVHP